MSDASNLIQTITIRWNAGLAEAAVQQISAQVWAAQGQPAQGVLDLIEQLRQVLKQQLTRATSPAEQMRVMEISYRFEQGIGNRSAALSLAKNLRHLSEHKADTLYQSRAAALLADAWHWVSAIPLAIDSSRRALQTAKPLEVKGQGGRPLKMMFVAEEVHLAWLMALQGGTDESVDKLLNDALNRYKTLADAPGRLTVLATWSQVRTLQGRWADAVDYTRQCLQAAGDVNNPAAVATALWAGARSASRLGDVATAKPWADEAVERSRASGDVSALVSSLLSLATTQFLVGDDAVSATADAAVALADAWKMEILRRWTMLERSWLRLALGASEIDEMRATVESLAKAGAGPLEAEARYALYHALKAAGQDAQAELDKAREQCSRLNMAWHAGKLDKQEPLLVRP